MDIVFDEAITCETILHEVVLKVNAAESCRECEQICFTMTAHMV